MKDKVERTSFEDALNATGYGWFNYLHLLLCSLLVMAMVFEMFAISYLVPASACELNTTPTAQGLMAGLPLLGVIATSHLWGYLADTKGRKKILILSLMLGFMMGSLSAFSPNWIVFCFLKMLSSSAMSGTFALAMTLLSECTPQDKRNNMVIFATSVFLVSPGLMAVLTIPILSLNFSYYIAFLNIHFLPWRLLSLLYTIPTVIGAIGVYFSCESPKYLASVGREDEALEVLKTVFVLNNGRSREEYDVKSLVLSEDAREKSIGLWKSIKSQTLPLVKPPFLIKTIIISIMIGIIYLSTNPYMVWLPTVLDGFMRSVERGDSGMNLCNMITTVHSSNITSAVENEVNPCTLSPSAMVMVLANSSLYAVLNTLMTTCVKYLGRRRMIIVIQLIACAAGFTMNFVRGFVASGVLFIIFLCPLLDISLVTTFSVDIYPTYLRAMAVNLTLMVGRLCAILGLNILKQLLTYNCEASFYVFSSFLMVGAVVAYFLPEDEPRKMIRNKEDDIRS